MSDQTPEQGRPTADLRNMVRDVIEEFVRTEQHKEEPAYKAELLDERKRRESLETRLNQLVEENRKARAAAEESDRYAQIRSELQRAGISKIDLAFRAMKDDIIRSGDGALLTKGSDAKSLREHVTAFVQDNPELLPARIAGGSGAQTPTRKSSPPEGYGISLDSIKPGMSKEELDRVREHISQLASQALRGA